ncbi:multidrug effflux MFS transporter [Agrobacterium sp. ES01]|uniref:multidrug effflux MFS transporter n=1 Tax=Agrobacterium sp. ES01 TaxID=3420714 RepID=UPI003D0A4622
MEQTSPPKTLPIAIALGSLCALGPFSTDMHVSAMPQMADDLATSAATIQMTMMTYFCGFTIGQLFYGPASDALGRKPVIFFALAVFLAGTIGCVLSVTPNQMLAFRFLQGCGGSIGMVIATATIRDLFSGIKAARLMSLVILVLGLAPVIAPLAGSMLLTFSTWRVIFMVMGLLCLVVATLVVVLLPETRMPALRATSQPSRAIHWYAKLLFTRSFIPYAGALAFAQGGFFAYIAGSSFVLINVYGLSPITFSVIFALNALGIGIGTQVSTRFGEKIGLKNVVRMSSLIFAGAAVLLVGMELLHIGTVYSVCILLFIAVIGVGGMMPSCNVLAMESQGHIAGTAAALSGALGFGAGALSSLGIGLMEDGTALPMLMIIAISAIGATLVAHLAFGDQEASAATQS